jgi:hypothetical protein
LFKNWAGADNPLGQFVYRTYNQTDFDEFFNTTTPFSKDFFLGIGKPNMTKNSKAESTVWDTKVTALFASKGKFLTLKFMCQYVVKSKEAPHQVKSKNQRKLPIIC